MFNFYFKHIEAIGAGERKQMRESQSISSTCYVKVVYVGTQYKEERTNSQPFVEAGGYIYIVLILTRTVTHTR